MTVGATSATQKVKDNTVIIESDGVINGIQMTIEHDLDFNITLAESYLGDYNTQDNITKFEKMFGEIKVPKQEVKMPGIKMPDDILPNQVILEEPVFET